MTFEDIENAVLIGGKMPKMMTNNCVNCYLALKRLYRDYSEYRLNADEAAITKRIIRNNFETACETEKRNADMYASIANKAVRANDEVVGLTKRIKAGEDCKVTLKIAIEIIGKLTSNDVFIKTNLNRLERMI